MDDIDLKSLFSSTTEFEAVASTFTVKNIMNPLDYFDITNYGKSDLDSDFLLTMFEEDVKSRFVVIIDDGMVIGVKDLYDDWEIDYEGYEDLLKKHGDRKNIPFKEFHNIVDILINKVISSDFRLIDLFPLLIREDYLLVLEKNSLSGYITFSDLDKMPVKLSLFALLLEFEANISSKLRKIENLDAYLVLLSDSSINKIKRMVKIQKRLRKQSAKEEITINLETGESEEVDENKISSYEAIKYLNIEEKQFLLREYLSKEHPLTDEYIALMDDIFKLIKSVRNLIAHGDSILEELEDPTRLEFLLTALLKLNELYEKL